MSKAAVLRCSDCYFRHAGLCALPGDTPCPTFRAFAKGTLVPPRQAPLITRPVPVLVAAAS
ncbi:MAG: hypothetical protein QOH73_2384 [Gaiellaceae bacterium]|nr:hypothetical protein [Gaiellaceae bacterium]